MESRGRTGWCWRREGKYNGFGGKVEPGESVVDAARRELREEAGISCREPVQRGLLLFEFSDKSEMLEVHVYQATEYDGEIAERCESGHTIRAKLCEEMAPRWFKHDEIPYEDMWKDDRIWMPLLLAGKKFQGWCLFRDMDTMLEHHVEEVEHLPVAPSETL